MLLMVSDKLTYEEAKTRCSDLGSQLVEFHTEQELSEVILNFDIKLCGYFTRFPCRSHSGPA